MVSFRSTLLALASVIAVTADYVINPDSVPLSTRISWCNDQKSSCPKICLQTTTGQPIVNDCDPEHLTYGCVCSDNKQPNISEYTLTIPYHTCIEWGNQCVTGCGTDNLCAADCREDHPCGAQNPTRVNTTSTSAASSTAAPTSSSSNSVFDGFAGDSGSSSSGNNAGQNAAGALRFGSSYGLAVVAAGMFAGFALLI
ncbi:hypothetical protein N656DRAFT_775065 [Canariomyces notabilis]|uniref:DUF7707 domain-containing protein n=1 Tax=Canariomyces notabilis TaxID=2074819 RepID=A0AAN6TLN6_9PEZI|nr:hypothetical protein N656DRAFT_775065 [Canariomyces arenarius]